MVCGPWLNFEPVIKVRHHKFGKKRCLDTLPETDMAPASHPREGNGWTHQGRLGPQDPSPVVPRPAQVRDLGQSRVAQHLLSKHFPFVGGNWIKNDRNLGNPYIYIYMEIYMYRNSNFWGNPITNRNRSSATNALALVDLRWGLSCSYLSLVGNSLVRNLCGNLWYLEPP